MKYIEKFGNFGPVNEELDADLEKKRDAYFKKLEAVSAAIREVLIQWWCTSNTRATC